MGQHFRNGVKFRTARVRSSPLLPKNPCIIYKWRVRVECAFMRMIKFELMGHGYLKEEAEADPLVVFVIAPFQRILCLVHPRVGNVETDPLPEGTEICIGLLTFLGEACLNVILCFSQTWELCRWNGSSNMCSAHPIKWHCYTHYHYYLILALQSGAHKRDLSHPIPSTYSFWAFKSVAVCGSLWHL